jgi:intein/homing endonuclease
MAHRRYAHAITTAKDVPFEQWMDEIRAQNEGAVSKNHVNRVANVILRKADPKQYLLSHATIVASVDAYAPKGVKTGRMMNNGVQIEVRYPDYRIKPEGHEIINNNCCLPGTMILMADGTEKPIEDVRAGDEVVSHTGNRRKVIQTFVHPHRGWVHEIHQRGNHRPLTLTGEHPVWASRPTKAGFRIENSGEIGWISAGLLNEGDLTLTPKLVGESNPSGITIGQAKLLGYYLAEGHLHKQKLHRVRKGVRELFPEEDHNIPVGVEFTLCKDEVDTIASEIVRLMCDEFGTDVNIGPHSSSRNAIKLWTNYAVDSVKFFKKYGGEHARTKKLHPEVLTWPVDLQRQVVQGWLEGDGSVKKTAGGWLTITTSSANLHSGMGVLLNRLGCVSSTHMTVRSGRRRVRVEGGGWQIVNDSTKSCVAYVTTINAVEAEKIVVDSFMEGAWRAAKSGKKNKFLEFRSGPDGIHQPIKKIEKKFYEGSVHNFETEIDHSYVANCTGVHNSDAWERSLLLSTYRTFIGAPNYCFVPGTKVLMADGTQRPIEDISVGDDVIGSSGLSKKVVHKHVRDYSGEIKLVYVGHNKIPIACTPNHPFARLDRTECMQCGQKLRVSNRPASYKKRIERAFCPDCGRSVRGGKPRELLTHRVAASDLEPRAILFAPIPKLLKQTAQDRDSVRFAKLMGFYLAEGCLQNNHGKPYGVVFSVGSSEHDLIQQILDCIRAVAPGSRPVVSVSNQTDGCIRIDVNNVDLALALRDVCGELSYAKRLSTEWMNSACPDEVLALIGAYASGDADVHHMTQRVRLCSVSAGLLEQVQFLASCVGLLSFIVEHGSAIGDSNMVRFADGTEHAVTTRHQAYMLHFDVCSSKKLCEYTTTDKKQTRRVSAGDLKFLGDKRVTYVNKIESDSYSGKVYNLEVEDDHAYVINGTVQVFNCEHIQLPELSKGFIIDAISRDLGQTCYIDILVGTDRKHGKLVSDILSGEMSALSMGCFEAGSRVTMADGSVLPIEDVRPEMHVLSQKGNACRVDNLQIRENRWQMRRVKVAGLPATGVTDNHRFYVVPRSCIEYRKVSRGVAPIHASYPFEYREAGDLIPGDIVATPIPVAKIEPSMSEAEARLLGLWVGDGWKFDNKHDSTIGIGFCIDAKDRELIDWIEQSINQIAWKSGEMRIAAGGMTPKTVSKSTRRNANYLMSSCRSVRSMIDSHVSGRRALDKVIGPDVMAWPRSHQLAFLSGIVDSDGCVGKTRRGTRQVFISTRNENLANQYQVLLARCGIVSTVSAISRRGTKMLPNASGVDYQIRIRNDGASSIPSLKVQRAIKEIKYTPGNSDRWISEGYLYSRVKRVDKYEKAGLVFDMQVDRDHSYVVNGIGVSNCISLFTICTKCGNVAVDDAQLCFPAETRVTKHDGTLVPISEIVAGDRVLTHTGLIRSVTATMSRHYNGLVTCVDVTGVPNVIRSTPEHPYYVLKPKFKCACGCGIDLHRTIEHVRGSAKSFKRGYLPGHNIRIFNPNPHSNVRDLIVMREALDTHVQWVNAKDMCAGDYVALPIPTESVLTPDGTDVKAKLIGYFLAEGCFIKRNGRKVGVKFAFGAHEKDTLAAEVSELMNQTWSRPREKSLDWRELVRSMPDLVSRVSRSSVLTPDLVCPRCKAPRGYLRRYSAAKVKKAQCKVCHRVWDPCASIQIMARVNIEGSCAAVTFMDESVAQFFFAHCGEYAGRKRLSDEAMMWPPEVQRRIIAGWANGDGYQIGKSISVHSASDDLINQMSIIAARCGLRTRRQIMFGGKSAEFVDVVNGDGTVSRDERGWLPAFTLVISNADSEFADLTRFESGSAAKMADLHLDGYVLHKVNRVWSEPFHGQVHNLEVDEDHSYVVDGVAVHNCPCVQYEGKGNPFADENGVQHPIAELIGHVSVPNSNQFIEASWVKNPAFRGAVRRNFLNADTVAIASKLGEAAKIYEVRQNEAHPDELKRAASMRKAQGQGQGQAETPPGQGQGQSPGQSSGQGQSPGQSSGQGQSPGQSSGQGQSLGQEQGQAMSDLDGAPSGGGGAPSGGGGGGGAPSGGDEAGQDQSRGQGQGQGQGKNKIDQMLEEAQSLFLQNLVKSLGEKLAPKAEDVKAVVPSSKDWEASGGGNDNIVRSSQEFSRRIRKAFTSKKLIRWAENAYRIVHGGGVKAIRANKMTPQDLIVLSWIEDRVNGRKYSSNLYKVAMSVGAPSVYPSQKSFVAACSMRLGRTPTLEEQKFFIWKGKIASLVEF